MGLLRYGLFFILVTGLTAMGCGEGGNGSGSDYVTEGSPIKPVILRSGEPHKGTAPRWGASYYSYKVQKGPNLKLVFTFVGNYDLFWFNDKIFREQRSRSYHTRSTYDLTGEEIKGFKKVKPGDIFYFMLVNNSKVVTLNGHPTAVYDLAFQEY